MVRFKNRYFTCEICEQSSSLNLQALNTNLLSKVCIHEIKALNFGDMGAALVQFSLQIKYLNTLSRVFIVRVARDHKNMVWTTLSLMDALNGQRVCIRVLSCSGTMKKCEYKTKKQLQRWVHKILKNGSVAPQVKEIIQEDYNKIKKNYEEQSVLDQMTNKVKFTCFSLMHEMMNQFICSDLIYKLVVLIETMQLLYYTFHPQVPFQFTIIWYQYLVLVIQYLQLNYLISQNSLNILLLYVFIVIESLAVTLFFIVVFRVQKDKKISAFQSYSLKMLSLFGVCQNTVLSVPFINVFIVIFICDPMSPYTMGQSCYSGIYYVHLVFAGIGAIMYVFISLFFGFLYIELNPFSLTPFAGPQQKLTLYRLMLKCALLIYITLDYEGMYASPYVGVLTLIYLAQIIYRTRCPKSFNQSVYDFVIFCDCILLFSSFCIILHILFDVQGVPSNVGLFYMLIMIPFTYLTTFLFIERKELNCIKRGFRGMNKDTDMEEYINLLLSLIGEEVENQHSRVLLEGVVVQHIQHCHRSCPCQQLSQDRIDEHIPISQNKTWYMFIGVLIDDAVVKFPKSARMHLMKSYIQKKKLKNQIKSLYELIMIQELDPNIQEYFSIFRCKYELEQEMLDDEFKSIDGNQIDVSSLVNFQNLFVEFQHKISHSVKFHHEFWTGLLEESPDSLKLQMLGSQITTSVDEVEVTYKKLISINPNHIKCLQIYGNFQNDIINNEIEGPRILEKVDQIIKSQIANQFSENQINTYADNGSTCTLTVSGNTNSLGQILNSTREIHKILGFTKDDIMGQNVQLIMPKIIGDIHDSLMQNFLDSSQSSNIGKDRLIFAQTKSGFMVPCILKIKVLPVLDQGIQIIGFLKQMEHLPDEQESFFILYNPRTLQVYGITNNCHKKMNIPSSLVYGNAFNQNEFTLHHIIKDVKVLEEKQNENQNAAQFLLNIDTTELEFNFQLDGQESAQDVNQPNSQNDIMQREQSNLMETQDQAPFVHVDVQHTWKIKCHVIRYEFGQLDVNLLKFHELNEAAEFQKQAQKTVTKERQIKKKNVKKDHYKKKQQLEAQEVENEDRSSINSISSSLGDDMRQLKDFKAMISEKTVPKQIRNLQISLSLLTIVLIVIESINLYSHNIQNNQLIQSFYGLQCSYERQLITADLIFYSRLLEQLAIGTYQRVSEQTLDEQTQQYQLNITNELTNLQDNSFQIIQNQINLELMSVSIPPQMNYTINSLLQNNQNLSYQVTMNEAIIQLINQGMILKNVNISSFNLTDQITATQRSFYFIIQNGLYVIRNASEQISSSQIDSQNNLITQNLSIFMATLILNVVFLLLAQFILVPVLRNVTTSNKKVLSLFGFIPLSEIRTLALKCENYLQNSIEEKSDQITKTIVEVDPKLKPEPKLEQINLVQNEEKYFEVNNEEDDLKRRGSTPQNEQEQIYIGVVPEQINLLSKKESNKSDTAEHALPIKTKLELEQEQKQQDIEEIRVEKLQNFKGTKSSTLFLKLGMFVVLFCVFFVMQFILEFMFLQKMTFLTQHMHLTYYRPIIVKYSTYFGLEQIVDEGSLNTQLESDYHSRLYSNDRDLFNSIMGSFPSQFNQYLSTFQTLNYNDICNNLGLVGNYSQKWCQSVQSGILQKGLRTSIVSLALDTSDSMNLQSGQNLSSVINGQQFYELQQMLSFIVPSLNSLNSIFTSSLQGYINQNYMIDTIIYGAFIIGWVFLVLILWIPHLSKLSIQIWRTKGMLNLIPLSIIQKYDRLKDAFLHSNIFQMVK